MKRLLTMLFGLLILAAACKKDKNSPDGGWEPPDWSDTLPQPPKYKGMGASNELPEGVPFHLPAGITLNKIRFTDSCFMQNLRNRRGAGRGVQFCITFTNSTNETKTIELPPDVIFVSPDLKAQNGVLLTGVKYTIPARSTITFFMEVFCLNKWRKSTREGDELVLGPVTQNAELVELANMLKGKEHLLEMTGFETPAQSTQKFNNGTEVQFAVWEITDGSGKLSEATKEKIRAIK